MWNRDVLLAIGSFLVQCALAYLGLRLDHWKHKTAFAVLVLFGAIFTGIAVKRGIEASNRVEAKLSSIEEHTKIPPTVNVNPQIIVPPSSIAMPSQRHLSYEIQTKMTDAMRKFKGQRITVAIPIGDKEAQLYSADFIVPLNNAGWQEQTEFVTYDSPFDGMALCPGSPATQELRQFLVSEGITLTTESCPKEPDQYGVILHMGYSPNPNEIEAGEKKKRLEIRTELAKLISEGEAIKTLCISGLEPDPNVTCEKLASAWFTETIKFLQTNLEPSYFSRFTTKSGPSLLYPGAKSQMSNNLANSIAWKEAALDEFLKELGER